MNFKNGHRPRLFARRSGSAEEASAWKEDWIVLRDAEEILLCTAQRVCFRTRAGIDTFGFWAMNPGKPEFGRVFDLDWETCGQVFIGSGTGHIAILRRDGTAYALGNDVYGQCQIRDRMEWKDTVQISDGHLHTLGLKPDGTVIAHGLGRHGATAVQSWRDIVAVKAEEEISYGLLRDGRVITAPRNEILPKAPDGIDFTPSGETWEALMLPDGTYSERNPKHSWLAADWNQKWSELTALAVGSHCTAWLRRDGTVCFTGETNLMSDHRLTAAKDWRNIEELQIFGTRYLVGREKDGTYHYCPALPHIRIDGWRNIVKFDTVLRSICSDGVEVLLGIDTEHVLHAVGNREKTVRRTDGMQNVRDVLSLFDILFILRTDGTVACVPTCNEPYERMEKTFRSIEKQVRGWKNIRRIVGWTILEAVLVAGLREDGRVEAAVCDGEHSTFGYLTDLRDRAQALTGINRLYAGAGRLIVGDDDGKLYYYPE